MAFKDQNGKITIDEVAAKSDVEKLQKSVEMLRDVMTTLDQVAARSADFKGQTGEAILRTCGAFKKRLNRIVTDMEDSQNVIRNTVARYQQIDAQLKEQITGFHTDR